MSKEDCPSKQEAPIGPLIPRSVVAAPEACVWDSQGGFSCPGSAAYIGAWAAQDRAEGCRNEWKANWVHHGDTPALTYEMQWARRTKKCKK